MPPRKKSRVPARDTSLDETDVANTPGGPSNPPPPPTPKTKEKDKDDYIGTPVYSDGWTDEQEITLFKAISVYRWKPAGMHKHFRMLAIEQMMRNHGVSDVHTSAEGIWKKLHSLYNLEGLDEREDMDDDADSPGGQVEKWTEFKLPEEDFGELMAARRMNPEGTASPSHTMDLAKGKRKRLSESAPGGGRSGGGSGSGVGGAVGGGGGGDGSVRSGRLGKGSPAGSGVAAGGGDSDDGSELRSSPVSQRSGAMASARKRGSRLSAVRGISTPRGRVVNARGGASSSSTAKKAAAAAMARKAKLEKQRREAEEAGSSEEGEDGDEEEEDEEEVEEEGDGSGSDEEEEEEDEEGEDEEGDDEDEEADEDEEGDEEEDGPASPVSTTNPRTPRSGGGRRGRGGASTAKGGRGGVSVGKKKVASGQDVRRSTRKK